MVSINYEIPDDVHQRAKVTAAMRGITLREFIIQAIAAYSLPPIAMTPELIQEMEDK